MGTERLLEAMEEAESEQGCDEYSNGLGEALATVALVSLCGLKTSARSTDGWKARGYASGGRLSARCLQTIQKSMNLLRKFTLRMIKQYESKAASKRPLSRLMFDCLLDSNMILRVLAQNGFPRGSAAYA